ncbi:MAG: hypothetical protein KKC46_16300 [Proteobacteria bacterium]|nr:hypothetical protein [Pseudomonadota bacterium]
MEYINTVNIITAIVVFLMIYNLTKVFTASIGENRVFYVIAFIVLGAGLYFWKSGAASEIIANISGVMK